MYGYLLVELTHNGKVPAMRGMRKNISESLPEPPVPPGDNYMILEVEADGDYEVGLVGEIKNCRPIKIVLHYPAGRATFLQKVGHYFGNHFTVRVREEYDYLEGFSSVEYFCPICRKRTRKIDRFPKGELCR